MSNVQEYFIPIAPRSGNSSQSRQVFISRAKEFLPQIYANNGTSYGYRSFSVYAEFHYMTD